MEEYRTTTQVTQAPSPILGGPLLGLALPTSLAISKIYCLFLFLTLSQVFSFHFHLHCLMNVPLSAFSLFLFFIYLPLCISVFCSFLFSVDVFSPHFPSSVYLPGVFRSLSQPLSGSSLSLRVTPVSVPGLYQTRTPPVSLASLRICFHPCFIVPCVSISAFLCLVFLAARLPSGFLLRSVSL